MSESTESNNERLRALVATLELPPPVLLTIFNRGLGGRACTASVWRGWLEPVDSPRFVPLSDEMWQHAARQLGSLARAEKADGGAPPEVVGV